MKLHQKIISAVCAATLLGAVVTAPVSVYASPSEKVAEQQKEFTKVTAYVTIAAAAVSAIFTPGCMFLYCPDTSPVRNTPGIGSFNLDIAGAIVDGVALWLAGEAGVKWKDLDDNLQAAVRKIAEPEGLEESKTEDKFINTSKILVESLETTGLEALEDPEGSIPKTLDEIMSAQAKIQDAFGTVSSGQLQSNGSSNGSGGNSNGNSNGSSSGNDSSTSVPSNANLNTGVNPENLTAQALEVLRARRREAHLQKVATAGAARAHLMKVVVKGEAAASEEMAKLVGKGNGLVANIKLVTAFDLALAQRLNTLNMVLGQLVANEAAAALQQVAD